MATLSTKSFTELVREQVTAIQGAVSGLVDLAIGSILRSIIEANAGAVGMWLQGMILQLLATTRAATSSGDDLDSWVGDYGLTRLPATYATGDVTFSRFTSSGQIVVPFNASIQTGDGEQQYVVAVDSGNSNYSETLGGYIMADAVGSISVPIEAVTAGAAGNAQAGQINTITTAIPGVDTVTNPLTFTSGEDAESDADLRVRFVAYLASLARATKAAIGYAISSVQSGVTYQLVENESYAGSADLGYFYAVVDDGSGSPGVEFLNSVANAIEQYRAFTIRYGVYAPVTVNATVVMTATIDTGYDATATKLLVQEALQAHINGLIIGEDLPYTRLAQVAYDASEGVINITSVTLNGGTSDLTATVKQIIKATSVTVN